MPYAGVVAAQVLHEAPRPNKKFLMPEQPLVETSKVIVAKNVANCLNILFPFTCKASVIV